MSTATPLKNILIGDLLVRSEMTTPRNMADAVPISLKTGLPIGRVLIGAAALTEAHLQQALVAQSLIRDSLLSADLAVQALRIVVREGYDFDQALNIVGWHPESFTNENRLGQLLLHAQVITQQQLEESLRVFYSAGLPLARVLVLKGIISNLVAYVALTSQQMLRDGKLSREQAVQAVQAAKASRGVIEKDYIDGYLRLQPTNNIRLGELFVRANLVEDGPLVTAVEQAIKQGTTLGEVLVERGTISEQTLERALETQRLVTEEILDVARAGDVLRKADHERISARQAMAKLGPSVLTVQAQTTPVVQTQQPSVPNPSAIAAQMHSPFQHERQEQSGAFRFPQARQYTEQGQSVPAQHQSQQGQAVPQKLSGQFPHQYPPRPDYMNGAHVDQEQNGQLAQNKLSGQFPQQQYSAPFSQAGSLNPENTESHEQAFLAQQQDTTGSYEQQFFAQQREQFEQQQQELRAKQQREFLQTQSEPLQAPSRRTAPVQQHPSQPLPLQTSTPEQLPQPSQPASTANKPTVELPIVPRAMEPAAQELSDLSGSPRPLAESTNGLMQPYLPPDETDAQRGQRAQPAGSADNRGTNTTEAKAKASRKATPHDFFNTTLELPDDVEFAVSEDMVQHHQSKRRSHEETLARELVSRLQAKLDALNTRNDYLGNMLESNMPRLRITADHQEDTRAQNIQDFDSAMKLIEKLFGLVETSAYRNGYLLSRVDMASVHASLNERVKATETQVEETDRRLRDVQEKWLESDERLRRTRDRLAETERQLKELQALQLQDQTTAASAAQSSSARKEVANNKPSGATKGQSKGAPAIPAKRSSPAASLMTETAIAFSLQCSSVDPTKTLTGIKLPAAEVPIVGLSESASRTLQSTHSLSKRRKKGR